MNDMNPPKGHVLSPREMMTAELIQELMCNSEVDIGKLSEFENYENIITTYEHFESDGLIIRNGSFIAVTKLGENYLRNIAEVMDFLRSPNSKVKYSSAL